MFKNVDSQKWIVFAFNSTTNVAVTGDAANITAKISIDGAAGSATNDTNPTELEDGKYVFDLTQAETNGDLLSILPESSTSNVVVRGEPASIYTREQTPDVNVAQISGDSTAADNLEAMYDGTGYSNGNAPATQTQATDIQGRLPAALDGGRMDCKVNSMGADVINAATLATDTIGSDELAASAINEIRDAILADSTSFNGADVAAILTDTADMQPKLGTPAGASISADIADVESKVDDLESRVPDTLSLANINAEVDTAISDASLATSAALATVDSNVDAILADTADMQPKLGTPAADLSADIAAVKVDTAATLADTNEIQTDLADGGRLDLLIDGIKTVTDALGATAAARLALSGGQIIPFTVDTATNSHTPTTTEFQADDITEATADHYNGRIVIFTSGALAGQATDITDYEAVGGIGQFTITALTEAPANNDTGIIV